MKYYLTQHYTIEHTELYDLTSQINKTYAESIGFEYISNNITRCADRQVWWEKIAWLMELLSTKDDGDMIIYEDCDSLNIGGDLKSALHDNMEFGMIQLRAGLGGNEIINWYNAGVIMLINTPDVRAFLKRVWDRNDDTDETSINKELQSLGYTIGRSKSICSLGVEWNCWKNNNHIPKEIYIKSWHGMKYEDKVSEIKQYISSINQSK